MIDAGDKDAINACKEAIDPIMMGSMELKYS